MDAFHVPPHFLKTFGVDAAFMHSLASWQTLFKPDEYWIQTPWEWFINSALRDTRFDDAVRRAVDLGLCKVLRAEGHTAFCADAQKIRDMANKFGAEDGPERYRLVDGDPFDAVFDNPVLVGTIEDLEASSCRHSDYDDNSMFGDVS